MAIKNSNLQRWVTGIILAAILLAVIILGPVKLLTAVIILFVAGGVWE